MDLTTIFLNMYQLFHFLENLQNNEFLHGIASMTYMDDMVLCTCPHYLPSLLFPNPAGPLSLKKKKNLSFPFFMSVCACACVYVCIWTRFCIWERTYVYYVQNPDYTHETKHLLFICRVWLSTTNIIRYSCFFLQTYASCFLYGHGFNENFFQLLH